MTKVVLIPFTTKASEEFLANVRGDTFRTSLTREDILKDITRLEENKEFRAEVLKKLNIKGINNTDFKKPTI